MLDRPMLTKVRPAISLEPQINAAQRKPSLLQFQLRVDGQTKTSFPTLDAAEKAALIIKRQYPVVQVSVYDSVAGDREIIMADTI